MRVRTGDCTYPEVPAKVEPADDVLTSDYYTLLPQIRLTGNSTGRPVQPETPTEVMLDGNDVANLVECAIRHPAANMRYAVLAAIWSHPDSFSKFSGSVSKHLRAFLKYARSWRRSLIGARLHRHLQLRTGLSRPSKRCNPECPDRHTCKGEENE